MKATITFIKVDAKNPINEPIADFKACLVLLFELKAISPIKAPKKGPIKNPNGGINSPTIKPMVHP